jgi:hypothetical protein
MNLSPIAAPLPSAAPAAGTPGEADAAAFSDCLEDACAAPPATPTAMPKPAAARLKTQAGPHAAADAAAIPTASKPVPEAALGAEGEALPVPAVDAPSEDAAPIDLTALLPGWVPPATATTSEPVSSQPSVEVALGADAPRSATALRVLDAVARDLAQREVAQGDGAAPIVATALAPTPARSEASASLQADRSPPHANIELPATARAPETPLVALPPAAVPPAAHAAPSVPAPPAAALAPPPHHPDFAPALATQVRWWAEAGVQQAQLTLNPPEMGPVAVRIVVSDAREALIDFGADLATTRQAIEAALPVLAAALDESGLKLAGGGVHDGASQRQEAWQQARAHSAKGATPTHAAPVTEHMPARTPAVRGIVDLVA